MATHEQDPVFEELLVFLKENRGFDFTGYKRASLMRRVRRRMEAVDIDSYESYRDYLELHADEFEKLFNTILINYTGFFRDQAAWDYLQDDIFPELVRRRPDYTNLRIWSAGCASGEEAYSLAILAAETMGVEESRNRVKIYATDVDEEALVQARRGTYNEAAIANVPEAWREKYFTRNDEGYVFRSDLRRMLIFGRHDLLQDAPISRLDLLTCRNTLIYFNRNAQKGILSNFHFALKSTAYLFLGHAEMLLAHEELFEPVAMNHRIFRKNSGVSGPNHLLFSQYQQRISPETAQEYIRLQEIGYEHAPVALIALDRSHHLASFNHRAEAIFNLEPRDRGRPFRDLELSYRPVELRSAIDRVVEEDAVVRLEDVKRSSDGGEEYWDVEITPLHDESGELVGTQIAFSDVTQRQELRRELEQAKQEVETTNEELQSTNEELETSNEELQSTIEELQTTNEELQSTNEEMETMNEELRSANEELHTINQELRERTGELDQTNAFLNSILASVDAGIVVIDNNFKIMLWNDGAEELWGILSREAVGRSLLSLDIGLPVEQLRVPINAIMHENDADATETTLDAHNRRGQPIVIDVTQTVRLDPTGDRVGVVLLMEKGDRQ